MSPGLSIPSSSLHGLLRQTTAGLYRKRDDSEGSSQTPAARTSIGLSLPGHNNCPRPGSGSSGLAMEDLGRTWLSEIKGAPGENHQPPGPQDLKKLDGLGEPSLPVRLVSAWGQASGHPPPCTGGGMRQQSDVYTRSSLERRLVCLLLPVTAPASPGAPVRCEQPSQRSRLRKVIR